MPAVRAAGFVPQCVVVQPDEIPFPQDQLLVHHAHMTEVLQKHHGRPVEVHVQDWRLDGDLYTRKIALTPAGSDTVVEWGIVRMDFRYMSQAVRDEILARQTPLGAILIEHNVLRRIKPRWFLRFPQAGRCCGCLSRRPHPEPGGSPTAGSARSIATKSRPSKLLEIVAERECQVEGNATK